MKLNLTVNKATVKPRPNNGELADVELEVHGTFEDKVVEQLKEVFTKDEAIETYGLVDPDEERIDDAIERLGCDDVLDAFTIKEVISHHGYEKILDAIGVNKAKKHFSLKGA